MIELHDLKPNSVVVVAGPTASGKSALALDIALKYNGVIINADSMQVYQGTPIISAVPDIEERQKVNHYLYEIFPPNYNGTVVEWLNLAVVEIKKAWSENKLPIVVGGTGLYIDNLINGTTPIPEVSRKIRIQVKSDMEQKGVKEMHRLLSVIDAKTASKISDNDTTRVRRAWEIYLETGKTMSEWFKIPMLQKIPEADFLVVTIIPTAQELDERCYLRFDKMIAEGALEEVKKIKELNLDKNLPAMKMLGIPELCSYLDGKCSLDEAVSLAKLHTRQYAKRQRTWFKNKLKAQICLEHCYP